MDTRKIKVMKSAPKGKSPRAGTWRELLFTRMTKVGNCFVAKLNKNHKAAIYSTIHQNKAQGHFSLTTLEDGRTQVERVK